ncbi:MAG: VIT domain-containing protein [Marivibrio sp.]|uniref:VIT domain-containing protein n=1 Tax=Marivibrio sp. TaxID=2039719 RepID=UPI0032EC8896
MTKSSPIGPRRARAALAALTLALALAGAAAAAQTAPTPDRGLLLRGEEGRPTSARLISAEMTADVAGPVAEVRLRQVFRNDGPASAEAAYLFPLPPDAAIHAMRIRIGERVIDGVLKEREAARRSYQAAKREGRRAGLLEQQRPNLFTTAFANVPAGATVSVDLAFQSRAQRVGGAYELSLPQVVTRRYIPALQVALEAPEEDLWRRFAERLADAAAIDVAQNAGVGPSDMRTGAHALDLLVRLKPGATLAEAASPTHAIDVRPTGGADAPAYLIRFAKGVEDVRGDVVLRWRPEVEEDPATAVFVEERPDGVYLLGQILPPSGEAMVGRTPPRDVTFILDRSGSMHGEAMAQAKRALAQAIDQLTPQDRFDVIRFDDRFDRLFGRLTAADPAVRDAALAVLADTKAEGGTEMAAPLAAALAERGGARALRQIVFLTDGAVGAEVELFALVARELEEARLFTIGLGPAPNDWFLRKAAEFGRGASLRIADLSEAEARMAGFYRRIARPALTDLSLMTEGDAGAVIRYPARTPDLYAGEPAVFAMKLDRMPDGVMLTGARDGRPFSLSVPSTRFQPAAGVARAWARKRIAALMDRLPLGADEAAVREAVLETAFAHDLMSRWTSFVAVERRIPPERDAALDGGSERVRLALAVSGPATALGLDRRAALGLGLLLAGLLALALLRAPRRGAPLLRRRLGALS